MSEAETAPADDFEVTVEESPDGPSLADFVAKAEEPEEDDGGPQLEVKADEPATEEPKADDKPAEVSVESAVEAAKKAQMEELTPLLREAHQAFIEAEQLRNEVQEYSAVVELLQQERAQLMQALRDANLVTERDAKLRQYELQELAQQKEAALAQARAEERARYEQQVAAQKREAAVEAETQRLMKEIPAALSKYDLVSEDELCALIERTPGNPPIEALAKQIHEAKFQKAKAIINAERREKRAMPMAVAGRRAPTTFAGKGPTLADILAKHTPG